MTSNDLITLIRKAIRTELDLYFTEKFGNATKISESVKQKNHHTVNKNNNNIIYTNENLNTLRSQIQTDIQSLYNTNTEFNDAYEMIPDSIIGDTADIPIDKKSAISSLQNTIQGQAVLNALTKDYSSMFKK